MVGPPGRVKSLRLCGLPSSPNHRPKVAITQKNKKNPRNRPTPPNKASPSRTYSRQPLISKDLVVCCA